MKPNYCFFLKPLGRRLDQIFDLLHVIKHKEQDMSVELEALKAQVVQMQTAVSTAVALLNELSTRLAGAVAPSELTTVTVDIQSAKEALEASVSANTPVA